MPARLFSYSLALTAFASAAFAGDLTPVADTGPVIVPDSPSAKPRFVFTLRGGAAVRPEYFGSDDYKGAADFGFRFNYLALGNGREFGNPDPWADPVGLSFGGSFRFIEERAADDYDELAGLEDVDAAIELGGSVRYGTDSFAAFGDVRRGFGGHEGWVAELGADVLMRPSDRLRLSVGPRFLFGDDSYSDTYFGVGVDEASNALSAYDPDGGLVSAGIEFGARYQINDLWGLEGIVTYDKLQGDAADSPVVDQGSDEQWGVQFGVTRVFSIGG